MIIHQKLWFSILIDQNNVLSTKIWPANNTLNLKDLDLKDQFDTQTEEIQFDTPFLKSKYESRRCMGKEIHKDSPQIDPSLPRL